MLNTDTEILLLDEPFSAIDESKKESLFKKIMSLDKTIIMITHDIGDNLNAFDNILFMEEGNLIYNLPYEEIKETREFLELKASNNLSQ